MLFSFGSAFTASPWNDTTPVRQELFGVERLELHAQSLATAQTIARSPQKVVSLHARLDDNARRLLQAYRGSIIELDNGRPVVPAAEWLLDNLCVLPAIPHHWPCFEAVVCVVATTYRIRITQQVSEQQKSISQVILDDTQLELPEGAVRVKLDGREHDLQITLAT